MMSQCKICTLDEISLLNGYDFCHYPIKYSIILPQSEYLSLLNKTKALWKWVVGFQLIIYIGFEKCYCRLYRKRLTCDHKRVYRSYIQYLPNSSSFTS